MNKLITKIVVCAFLVLATSISYSGEQAAEPNDGVPAGTTRLEAVLAMLLRNHSRISSSSDGFDGCQAAVVCSHGYFEVSQCR